MSMKTLKMIAIGMGPVVLGAGIYFKWRTEQNFMKQGFYEASIKAIMLYPPTVEPLGPPIKFMRVNLGDTGKNRTDGMIAHVAIPVTGTKKKGTFYAWCSKEEVYSQWNVDKIDLEINNRRRTVFINPNAKDKYQPTETDEDLK